MLFYYDANLWHCTTLLNNHIFKVAISPLFITLLIYLLTSYFCFYILNSWSPGLCFRRKSYIHMGHDTAADRTYSPNVLVVSANKGTPLSCLCWWSPPNLNGNILFLSRFRTQTLSYSRAAWCWASRVPTKLCRVKRNYVSYSLDVQHPELPEKTLIIAASKLDHILVGTVNSTKQKRNTLDMLTVKVLLLNSKWPFLWVLRLQRSFHMLKS